MKFYDKLLEEALSPNKLNVLFTVSGGNKSNQRTLSKTQDVLRKSAFYSYACCSDHLVGFGRVITDPYFAIILDLYTHPDYRRQGIATEILKRLVNHCHEKSLPIHLIDGSGVPRLYEKMGFKQADPSNERILYLSALG